MNLWLEKKNKAKKEALRATCFSITRPVSFNLDAFDLEVLEDAIVDNAVPREEITLKDVAWKNAGTRQYSLDRIAALDDDFLMDYTPTEGLSCRMDFETEARTSHDICNLEASMEKLRYDNSFLEELSHLKIVGGVEGEPPSLVKIFDKNEREHVEVSDMAGLENHKDREANRVNYNDRFSSEECVNHRSEAEEDPPGPLKPLAVDQTNREMMQGPEECVNHRSEAEEDPPGPLKPLTADQTNGETMQRPDLLESENGMNQAREEDHVSILKASAEVTDIGGSENHMEREAGREKCNNRFLSEGVVNLHSEVEEEPLSPVKSLAEDQGNREKMKGLHLPQSENEVHQVMEEDHVSILEASVEVPGIAGSENHIGREESRENNNDEFYQEEYLNPIAEVEEKSSGLFKPFGEEQTNREKMRFSDGVQPENEVHHVMDEDCNLGASVKKLQAIGFSPMDLEEPSPLFRSLGEEIQTSAEQGNFPPMRTSKDGKCQVAAKDHPLSVTLDTTPQSKLRDASGATTPRFMLISTPASKERARFSRKRKCFFDDL